MIFWLPVAIALDIGKETVKILQMTDLHYGEGEVQDRLNTAIQENLLKWEKPDLVVITGDMVSGYAWPGTKGWYLSYYSQYIAPMEKYNTPWALVLGNHDIEADITAEEIMAHDRKHFLSLASKSISSLSHSANYYVPISHKGELSLILWAVNTGNRNHLEFGWDRIHEDQLEWIKSTQQAMTLASSKAIPGMIFVHIPPPEFMDLWDSALGHRYENVACPGNHTRYVLGALNDIIAIAAGHDHYNDFEGIIGNYSLYYGRKTGYAGNGPEPYFNKGARVFEYNFITGKLSSWIRDEIGEKVVLETREGMLEAQTVCAESQQGYFYIFFIIPGLVAVGFGLWSFRNSKEKPAKFMV